MDRTCLGAPWAADRAARLDGAQWPQGAAGPVAPGIGPDAADGGNRRLVAAAGAVFGGSAGRRL